ncbi:Uncharacterized protein BWINRASL_01621 [Bacillus mycoides]|nr:Uncharacterized protein BWINRASL_01621 [Bacillus mycoides]
MSSNYRKHSNHCWNPCAFPIPEPPPKPGVLAYAFSEPVSRFTTPPPITVTTAETPITTVTINTPQNTLIELRGLVGWNNTVPAAVNILVFWRIRRGIGGPIIWEGHDGIGLDTAELRGAISSMLHVDNNPSLGPNTYQLTAQVDQLLSPGDIANITGPIVFTATAYSI